MRKKNLLLLILGLAPLLLACASPLTIEEGVKRSNDILTKISDSTFSAPKRYQIHSKYQTELIKGNDYKKEERTFVCDVESYKLYQSIYTESEVQGTKIKSKKTEWYWIDDKWSFHHVYQDETIEQKHTKKDLSKEASIEIFNSKAAVVPAPILETKLTLNMLLEDIKDGLNKFEYDFSADKEGSLYVEREQTFFANEEKNNKNYEYFAYENNLIYKGESEVINDISETKTRFEYKIDNVSVKLPELKK